MLSRNISKQTIGDIYIYIYIYVHAHAVYVLDNMCGLDAQQSLEQEVHVRVSLACIQQCITQQSIDAQVTIDAQV